MSDNSETFWSRMEATNAGMLGIAANGKLVPMSHYVDRAASSLWFITAHGTDLVTELEKGPQAANYVLASGGDGLYARITGSLALNTDPAKLDEIWNAIASSWFEGGKRDPDIRLLQFSLTEADVWTTTTRGLAFFYEIAKSKVTGDEPDTGAHFTLAF
jgi:general stress protein 26